MTIRPAVLALLLTSAMAPTLAPTLAQAEVELSFYGGLRLLKASLFALPTTVTCWTQRL